MITTSRRPARIALCITELEVGGAERALVELATRLDREQFIPTVYVLGPRPTGEQSILADRLDRAGIVTHWLDARSKWTFRRVMRKLTQLFRDDQPDVVHSFLFHANAVAAIAARRAGVPRVIAGLRVAEPRWTHRLLTRWIASRVDYFACVSEGVARFSGDYWGLPEAKLRVIRNGIDVRRFMGQLPIPLEQLGVPAGRRAVVFIGRLDRQKGIDWLLRAAPQIFSRLPTHDLVIVGQGPMRRRLGVLCERLKIADRVHFVGWRNDMEDILAACDLLVLPSRWEGMPNVVLEAMAAGKPVVANDVEGIRELLTAVSLSKQKIIIQVARPGDVGEFVARVVELADPIIGPAVGKANQSNVRLRYAAERMVTVYQDLYREALRGVDRPMTCKSDFQSPSP